MNSKALFLVPYPLGVSPSQRFRFEQYLGLLKERGYDVKVHSFLTSADWRELYNPGQFFVKGRIVARGLWRRFGILGVLTKHDIVFIHREVLPFGPPIFEWLIAKIFRKPIIYDFDDAIWLTDRNSESLLVRATRFRSKVKLVCGWARRISVGNTYLYDFAKKYCNSVTINPTTIDTTYLHNPESYIRLRSDETISIGWTGSRTTLKYLEQLEPVLKRIEEKYPQVIIIVIADRRPSLKLQSLTFLPWSKRNEIVDLMKMDIGIMPLPEDEWTLGKCGFKALQYMALGKPVVISSVGVNKQIIEDGVNGFLAKTTEDWEHALSRLVEDEVLREKFGKEGRRTVEDHYSILSNAENFFSLFL
jgi:glycosyltransferase involved in cell wall biosynthesis